MAALDFQCMCLSLLIGFGPVMLNYEVSKSAEIDRSF